jgi:hypothetical protein
MKYVEIDELTGEVTWDAYFEYLRSEQSSFPTALYSYAIDWDHYSLDGTNSLHDAWLVSVQIGYRNRELILEFLGARQDRKHIFAYADVERYRMDLEVTYKRGDRDVMAHEFTIDDGRLVHEIAFSKERMISISAAMIVPRTEVLS